MKYAKIKNFLRLHELTYARESALESIFSIKNDFSIEMDELEYRKVYLHNNSAVMKASAFRFLNEGLKKIFFQAAIDSLHASEEDYLFHPIFYLRISRHDVNYSESRANCLLDSQPHYDRSFGIPARTFWVPLDDVDKSSGGLCFFNDSKVIDELFKVEWGDKNIYNYSKYLENYVEIDKKITDLIVHPDLEAGDAYSFGSNVLHAATRPISAQRLSFDFRLIHKRDVNKANLRDQKIINFFNENLHLSNTLNSYVIGDLRSENQLQLIGPQTFKKLDSISKGFPLEIPRDFVWQDEYKWIDLL